MKNFKFLPFAVAALALGACSSDNEGVDANANGEAQYLAVTISNVGTTPSGRPAVSPEYDDAKTNGIYEDGTTDESSISKVRFFFYNADKSPYILASGGNVLEESITKDKDDHNQTVEQVSKAVLVIKGQKTTAPAYIVAVANPETMTNLPAVASTTQLSALKAITDTKYGQADGKELVMSNSVFVNGSDAEFETYIADKVKKDQTSAENDPADIYIERVAAKVTAYVDNTTGSVWESDGGNGWKIRVGALDNGTSVYAHINGWRVADEDGTANLAKNISAAWQATTLGINPWTTSDYHRSFWETSVAFSDANVIVNDTWTSISKKLGQGSSSAAATVESDVEYTLPNTGTEKVANVNENSLTKVIVSATLKDAEGNAITIVRYNGVQYTDEASALTVVANKYAKTYYTKSNDTYTSVAPTDIEFTATGSSKDYNVTVAPKAGVELYTTVGSTWTEATAAAKTDLAKEEADVYKSGMTYYYTPIAHLGTDGTVGQYGVVRNHSYKVFITGIEGFGTPVYDPNKVIDPTVPSDEKTYLAARINVLSWRVVKQSIKLDATK